MAEYLTSGQVVYEADIDNLVNFAQGEKALSGCAITAQASPNMTVKSSAGVIQYAGATVTAAAVDPLTVSAADVTNPRVDLVEVDGTTGVVTIKTGTPGATPKPPTLTAGRLLLAYISVGAAAVNIQASNITERRLLGPDALAAGTLANRPTAAIGGIGGTYFATDASGGTLYRSNGTTWTQVGGSSTIADAAITGGSLAIKGPRPWIDVRAYSVTGDGTTDDGANIQTAANAIPAAGGTLFFPDGTYIIGAAITLKAGTIVRGQSITATILKHKDSFNPATNILNTTGVADCHFEDFTWDGNAANNAAFMFAEILLGARNRTQNVLMKNWRHIGFDAGSSTSTDFARIGSGTKILGNGASSIDGSGVQTSTTYGIWSAVSNARCIVEPGVIIRDCSYGAILGGGWTILIGVSIEGNHRSYSPTGGGQIADAAAGMVIAKGCIVGEGGGPATSGFELNNSSIISGNQISGQGSYAVILQAVAGTGHIITNNRIYDPSGGASVNREGIRVSAGITDFTIIGNQINDTRGGGALLTYGIRVSSGGSDRYTITGNLVRGAVTSQITDGGSGVDKHVFGNTPTSATPVRRSIWVTLADAGTARTGAPALGMLGTNTQYRGAAFDAAATEEMFYEFLVPDDYLSGNLIFKLYWTNLGAGSGNVVWQLRAIGVADAANLNTTGLTSTSNTIAAPAQDILKVSTHTIAIAGGAHKVYELIVARLGGDGADTLANDAGLVSIEVEYDAVR